MDHAYRVLAPGGRPYRTREQAGSAGRWLGVKAACVWLVLVASCTQEPARTSAQLAPAGGRDAGARPAVAPRPPPPPPDAGPRVTSAELPAFARGPNADPTAAATLAHQAIRDATVGGDDPMTDARAAVLADPGSAYARYAIACVANDEGFATDQLRLLAGARCTDCVDPLRDVLLDTACPWTAAHKAIAASATPGPQRAAAEAIIAALTAVDRGRAAAWFSAARVTARFACSNCSDTSHDRWLRGTGARVLHDLLAALDKNALLGTPFVPGDRLRCAHDCCKVDWMLLQHNHVFLDQICFAPGTTRVRAIDLIDG